MSKYERPGNLTPNIAKLTAAIERTVAKTAKAKTARPKSGRKSGSR